MFESTGFTFAGRHSDEFGVFIASVGSSSSADSFFGVNQSLVETKALRGEIPRLQRVETSPIEFSIEISSEEELSEGKRKVLSEWLIKPEYDLFKSDDYENIYYRVVAVGAQSKTSVGNIARSITINFRADGPWAWRISENQIFTSSSQNEFFTINNHSNYKDLFYPEIIVKPLNSAGDIHLVNTTDDVSQERPFIFTGLTQNESIYIDNDSRKIVSQSGNYRLQNFNRKWLRLQPGSNVMQSTKASEITIINKFPIGV